MPKKVKTRPCPEGGAFSFVFLDPRYDSMSKTRFFFLITLVILSGGLTILVGSLAAASGKLDGQVAMALLPLIMLASIGIRALSGRNGS